MTPSIKSYLTPVHPTSELHAPSQLQAPSDFPSTATSASTDTTFNIAGYEDVDWSRLLNYKVPIGITKRGFKSWIYLWGWRVISTKNNEAYWLCRLCHNLSRASRPSGHIYKAAATNGATHHLRTVHSLTEDGHLPIEEPNQQTLDGFTNTAAMRGQFDFLTFKSKILRLFTTTQVPLSLIEEEAFRDLLIYLEPRLERSIPSRRTLRRCIETAYLRAHREVESDLRGATTRINISFDLWTSPGRRLSLLGVVAHYLNANYQPRNVLLALPRMRGSHTAVSIAVTLTELVEHFDLTTRLGNVVTDNASENSACIALLATQYAIDPKQRHVLCMGHVINLVAQQVLFGSDIDAFEPELVTTSEQLELQQWRKKGPIGKLHNLVKYITHSSNRQDRFHEVQRDQPVPLQSQKDSAKDSYDLIKDNRTRWNSWFDAAERALDLKQSIDDFVDQELEDYNVQMAVFNGRASQSNSRWRGAVEPKKPSIFNDRLTPEDWGVITQYVEVLRPCKLATMRLQGHVKDSATSDKVVTGALWMVLPIYEEILSSFEIARKCHPTAEKQRSQQDPLTTSNASPPTSPYASPSPVSRRTTRSSQMHTQTRASAPRNDPTTLTDDVVAEERSINPMGEGDDPSAYTDVESHFSTNMNLGWQKLDAYYKKTDATPLYRAAVVLHPRMKWQWIQRHWGKLHRQWVDDAHAAVEGLWEQYKVDTTTTAATTAGDDSDDDDADSINLRDQYDEYCAEPRPASKQMTRHDSPIPYWISKLTVWPQLAQMALDIYSTPACSDAPERVFSIAGNTLNPRRRVMTADTVQELLCLRSWQKSGLIDFDTTLFDEAVRATQDAAIADELAYNNTIEVGTDGDDDR